MKSVKESLERLYKRHTFGIKFGLHVEEAMLRHLGNPEREFAVIHVAGTNGKGSVSAMTESILRQAGFRTALYTSPHLVNFSERIRVGGEVIGDVDLGRIVGEIEDIADRVAEEEGQAPTFFECATAMAFAHFRNCKVQVAVVEVGMGGRLDATNVVTPALSVITRIGIEHTKYLGADLETIAGEKCGIIKPGRPVVTATQDERVLGVIRRTATDMSCTLVQVSESVNISAGSVSLRGQKVRVQSESRSYGTMLLPLQGAHQLDNMATAVAASELFAGAGGCELQERAVRDGIEKTRWPGRFQLVSDDPPVVLDGAHNPDAAAVLADTLRRVFYGRPIALVMGICDDKDLDGYLRAIGGCIKRVWAVSMSSERSVAPAMIARACRSRGLDVCESVLADALAETQEWARSNGGAVCIAGSLFLVGDAMREMGVPVG